MGAADVGGAGARAIEAGPGIEAAPTAGVVVNMSGPSAATCTSLEGMNGVLMLVTGRPGYSAIGSGLTPRAEPGETSNTGVGTAPVEARFCNRARPRAVSGDVAARAACTEAIPAGPTAGAAARAACTEAIEDGPPKSPPYERPVPSPVKEGPKLAPKSFPEAKEKSSFEASDVMPPNAADLKASFRLPPPKRVPIPEPRAAAPTVPAPNAVPINAGKPKADAAMGTTMGATFLTSLATDLNAFLTPLNIEEKKNSGIPVTGLMLFSSLPTTYRSGSSPICAI